MRTGLVFPGAEGRQRHVGQIRTTITLENRDDLALARRGVIPDTEVRRIIVDDVLVDTGANQLALPRDLVARLGLVMDRDVDVETASGFHKARIFRDVELTVGPRSATFECLELPGGERVVLGVQPLEVLGIELDLQNQQLVILPDRGPDTYVMAL